MQFIVPQYIEVKERIVGPLTLLQFFYIAGACAVSFGLFFLLSLWLWFPLSIILVGAATALALIEINGQPLSKILIQALNFFLKPRIYLWQREMEKEEIRLPEIRLQEIKKQLSREEKIKTLSRKIITATVSLVRERQGTKERYQVFRRITGEREVAKRVDYS